MRRISSSGSVKAISLDRDEAIRRLREVVREALSPFPKVREIRLIDSLATGTHTGISDADLLFLLDKTPEHPLEQMRPYFYFFSRRLDIGLDILLASPKPLAGMKRPLHGSLVLASWGL